MIHTNYCDKRRTYHNTHHIQAMLDGMFALLAPTVVGLYELKSGIEFNLPAPKLHDDLNTAIIYHDTIYDCKPLMEERSARLMLKERFGEDDVDWPIDILCERYPAVRYIMATVHPADPLKLDLGESIIHDLDLMSMGGEYDIMYGQTMRVIAENVLLSGNDVMKVIEGNAKFLDMLTNRDNILAITGAHHDEIEDNIRSNIMMLNGTSVVTKRTAVEKVIDYVNNIHKYG